jgi:hypothetical protein
MMTQQTRPDKDTREDTTWKLNSNLFSPRPFKISPLVAKSVLVPGKSFSFWLLLLLRQVKTLQPGLQLFGGGSEVTGENNTPYYETSIYTDSTPHFLITSIVASRSPVLLLPLSLMKNQPPWLLSPQPSS